MGNIGKEEIILGSPGRQFFRAMKIQSGDSFMDEVLCTSTTCTSLCRHGTAQGPSAEPGRYVGCADPVRTEYRFTRMSLAPNVTEPINSTGA
jgi:hypothetical protein